MKAARQLYGTLWRWHFYAGVFAIPFVLVLSITGAIYLFKPQLDAIHDRPYRQLSIQETLATPEQQVAAALASVPDGMFSAYQLPQDKADAAIIFLKKAEANIRVYVHPYTLEVLAVEREDLRFLTVIHDLHGELLLGRAGSMLVELAACWAIVLILTGIYLGWPRNTSRLGGVLYPRLKLRGRLFWRDLHSVTGIWIALLVLFLLLSGLPWTFVWGNAFKGIRQMTDAIEQPQGWIISGENAPAPGEHSGHQDAPGQTSVQSWALLNTIVTQTQQLHFAYPVLISPPSSRYVNWSAKSNTVHCVRRLILMRRQGN